METQSTSTTFFWGSPCLRGETSLLRNPKSEYQSPCNVFRYPEVAQTAITRMEKLKHDGELGRPGRADRTDGPP